jgi:CyaY protein
MDDRIYQQRADEALARIESLFEDVDADDVDLDRSGDVITLTFRNKAKCVINTQRPTQQIWLAANARAWHFSFDEGSSRWLDDKGQGVELVANVIAIVSESAGVQLIRS